MRSEDISICIGTLEEAYKIAQQISEFDKLYSLEEFKKRIDNKKHLIILSYYKDRPIGFKIGYETLSKKYFYSWMGGVIKKYRGGGAAKLMLKYQEKWIKDNNFSRILVKSRKKHQSMINLLLKNGYKKLCTIPYDPEDETRFLFEKEL